MLGAAWTTGALDAVVREYGWDPREAEVLIGTSAGSVLAASLGCGWPSTSCSTPSGASPAAG